ncbi:MAG: CHASE2 domain-containing protein [Armatimonadetes bacterium]|nr:CHASE2 domain-containing protein [Armatimonadota bacterium]
MMSRTSSNWHQRATWGMALGLIAALSLLLTLRPGFLGPLATSFEYDTLDFWFALRDPRQSNRVTILAIDEATVRDWNGQNFRARDIARAIRLLDGAGASGIALNLSQLCDPQLRFEGEAELIAAMRAGTKVVLPLELRQPQAAQDAPPPREARTRAGAEVLDDTWRVAAPSPGLLRAAAGAGHLNFTFDRFGRVRRLPSNIDFAGHIYPAFSTVTARLTSPRPLPEREETLLFNYPYGQSGEGIAPPAFATISLSEALKNPQLLQQVKGHAVIIGATAPGVATRFPTPTGKRISATEMQAVALDNLLSGTPLRRAPEVWHWLFSILPGVVVGGFAASRRPTWSGPVALLCVLTVAMASLGLFWQNIWLDTSVPWLTIALTFLVGVIGRSRRQERENTHITSTVEALTRVSDIIAAQTRERDLLDRVCHFATGALNATGASALILDPKGEVLTFAAALGPNSEKLLGQSLRLGEGIAGHVARSGDIAIVGEARGDNRFTPRIDAHIGFSTQNILCVPLRVRERILGVIEVVNRENGVLFTPADAEMLQAVANQAAVALDNARLYDRLEQRVEQSQGALAVANRQLQADKNLLQTVLHSMTDGVVVTDSSGQIQLLNPSAGELVPELADDAVGQSLAHMVEDFPLAVPPSAAKREAEEPLILQRGHADAPRYIEVSNAPLKTPDGGLAGLVTVFADVTQRRHIEQAKSDFVSFVAHEMRSPLTSISGFSAMLQKSEGAIERGSAPIPPASRTRFLGLIHEESERLTRLINNLLDVARLEAGHSIELNRDRVDFVRLATSALESQRAYSSRHTLIQSFEENLPLLDVDADKVTQILINLLSNALKYSPRGVVTLGARQTGDWLEVSVCDQGPGIAPEQMGTLFSRFGRTPTPAQGAGSGAKPTGTGLGLFLTKHLVEAHGGRIWVESGTAGGAVFRFTLPLAQN